MPAAKFRPRESHNLIGPLTIGYPASRGPSIFLDNPTYLGRSKGLCSQGNNRAVNGSKLLRGSLTISMRPPSPRNKSARVNVSL